MWRGIPSGTFGSQGGERELPGLVASEIKSSERTKFGLEIFVGLVV